MKIIRFLIAVLLTYLLLTNCGCRSLTKHLPKKSNGINYMSVNLNEFSEDVLQYAIEIFIEAQDDCNRKLSLIEPWQEGTTKKNLYNELSFKLDSAILFRVQLENALKEVQAKENITNC